MSEAARSRRDDTRYEPTLSVPGREPASWDAKSSDPLAELARLVGQEDPFRNVFRPAVAARPATVAGEHHAQDDAERDHASYDPYHGADDQQHGDDQAQDHHAYDPYDDHPDQAYDPAVEAHSHAADHGHQDRTYADHAHLHDDDRSADHEAPLLPDQWARSQDPVAGGAPPVDRDGDRLDRLEGKSSARRPIAVLGAVLLLTVGGLAASFFAKGPSSSNVAASSSGRGAPTILAASGPTKVKVDDGSTTAPEDQDAALLNKTGSLSSGPVKIVSSQEQPTDLGQLPKSDLADGARPLPQPSASPFPEPKKVKTFLVHPDGTMLSGDASASATAPSSPATVASSPAPLAATPKTAARGSTTPQSAPTIASLAADPAPADTAPPAAVPAPVKPARQPASPGVHQASAKPTDTAAALSSGGGYGVQLASSPNEADANAAFAKLKRKYPTQLGAYSATVHKAETGDKPVYRVRIGGMSQDEAKTLCSQLQTAGGSCFVMHN